MAFPENNLLQTAVYWGSPINNGEGGFTFDDPVEIDCRWVDKTKLILTNNGEEKVSMSTVQVAQDVDDNGMLYLGRLDDLSASEQADPMTVSGAYRIIKSTKTPTIKATSFYRKAYL